MSSAVAIISDIHGNVWALESVLNDIRKRNIDCIVNLGDSLYGPLEPCSTAKILMNEKIISISGNQDRIILESIGKTNIHQTMSYVINNLDAQSMEWIKSLSSTCVLQDNIFLCHGTPEDDDKYLLENITQNNISLRPEIELIKCLTKINQQIILCGHSHISRTVYLSSGKMIINPGSVGLQAYEDDIPYNHAMESGSPHARYSILTPIDNDLEVENIALPYCYDKAAECALKRNRHDWQRALLLGRV